MSFHRRRKYKLVSYAQAKIRKTELLQFEKLDDMEFSMVLLKRKEALYFAFFLP